MAVTKNAKTESATPASEPELQSIALELASIKRWTRVGDNTIYEAGTVYEFEPEKAKLFLSLTDDNDFPIWVNERQKKVQVRKPDEALDAESRHAHRERVRVASKPAAAPAPAETKKEEAPKRIDIQDDDPELAARLSKIDADGTDGAVKV